jgi:hypothetical protein
LEALDDYIKHVGVFDWNELPNYENHESESEDESDTESNSSDIDSDSDESADNIRESFGAL